MPSIHEKAYDLLQTIERTSNRSIHDLERDQLKKPDSFTVAKQINRESKVIAPDLEAEQRALPDTIQNTLSVGFELWEALAYDLALDHTDTQTILEGYGLTSQQLENLMANDYFSKMYENKKVEVQQLGTEASFVVKMRMIANRATPEFLKRLADPTTTNRDFHTLFKTAVELAQLIPKEEKEQISVGSASVTFNIQGVPGLEHLMGDRNVIEDACIVEPSDTIIKTNIQDTQPQTELLRL